MRPTVLSIHNRYRFAGGEDRVFAAESALLERNGHTVVRFEEDNARISDVTVTGAVAAGLRSIWNPGASDRVEALIHKYKPDLAHFHNTFPLVSPAGHYTARRHGLAVVQTLHNFRLLCPAATFFRGGQICEECTHHPVPLPSVVHGCYRNSRSASAGVAAMLTIHRGAGTWRRAVDLYLAPSNFTRQKFIQNGFPAERIVVKPNFVVDDPGSGDGSGGYALFVGRLSEEKGIATLAAAWRNLSDVRLLVAGDGPLASVNWPAGVTALGAQSRERVLELMKSARFLVFPSVCYENQPLTILEAFACGLPVIASKHDSVCELVQHQRNGLLFRPGDAEDLARQVRWAATHPEQVGKMQDEARREYEARFTSGRNYSALIHAYEIALERARIRRAALCA
jgi:glycosyltransferase involved in cell wall biosynthesis